MRFGPAPSSIISTTPFALDISVMDSEQSRGLLLSERPLVVGGGRVQTKEAEQREAVEAISL
jgi:hypothetical protein